MSLRVKGLATPSGLFWDKVGLLARDAGLTLSGYSLIEDSIDSYEKSTDEVYSGMSWR